MFAYYTALIRPNSGKTICLILLSRAEQMAVKLMIVGRNNDCRYTVSKTQLDSSMERSCGKNTSETANNRAYGHEHISS